ncbi:unnamed protein product, partial [Rotaria sp. Silwood1]
FDGEVDDIIDINTITHILASGDCRDVLVLQDCCPDAHVINVESLDACLSHGEKLNTDVYKL